jgi:hypothetical protein
MGVNIFAHSFNPSWLDKFLSFNLKYAFMLDESPISWQRKKQFIVALFLNEVKYIVAIVATNFFDGFVNS